MSNWNSLPGETPIDDISGLKPAGITTRKQLSLAEAENILKATVKYLHGKPSRRTAPFDLRWCLRLHRDMFGDVWTWAGKPRRCDLNIGVAWHQVEIQLLDMLGDLAYREEHWPDVLEQAVHLHHRAVYIHPFMGGNGRWSRMLANIWLRLHDHPITMWPEQTIGGVSRVRSEYLAAIKLADNGEMEPLIELHARFSVSAASESPEPRDQLG
jgi:Fic-DOC domain mobile mystery protein B